MTINTPIPTEINLHQQSKRLDITFDTDEKFQLTCEYLRVYSPSADVRGHEPSEAVLQVNKGNVNIEHIEPVGSYAVILFFDDGHKTGIYSWDWLYYLAKNQEQLWHDYLDKLEKSGKSRF